MSEARETGFRRLLTVLWTKITIFGGFLHPQGPKGCFSEGKVEFEELNSWNVVVGMVYKKIPPFQITQRVLKKFGGSIRPTVRELFNLENNLGHNW